jgi:hypothetical protein
MINYQVELDEMVCHKILTKKNSGYNISLKFDKIFARNLSELKNVQKAILLSVVEILGRSEEEQIIDYAHILTCIMNIEKLEKCYVND